MVKTLVAYFSATGTTEKVAEKLKNVLNCDIEEIVPAKVYTSADLNWNDKNSRSSIEMNDKLSRPEIKNNIENIKDYNTIYLGFPIWWDLAPTIINTFLESYDFTNKTIIPFATSGGSNIDNAVEDFKSKYSHINFRKGKRLSTTISTSELSSWINK